MDLSEGWVISVYRVDRFSTTEAEELDAMASAGIKGTERISEGGWIADIPEPLATLDGSDLEFELNGVDWRIEVPGV
jgi:hypothetical protein